MEIFGWNRRFCHCEEVRRGNQRSKYEGCSFQFKLNMLVCGTSVRR